MIAMLAGFFFILSGIAVGLWNYAAGAANRTYDLLLDGSAIAILERISVSQNGVAVDFPPSALEILGLAERDRVFYRIFSTDGRTVTGSEDLPLPGSFKPSAAHRFFDASYRGAPMRFVVHGKTLAGPSGSQWINVQVGQTRLGRNDVKYDLFVKGMIGLTAIAVAGMVFVRIAISLAMRPLSGIVADIANREPSDLEPLKAEPPREVEGLISAINGFMRRLEFSKDNAQTFIADVAHQIRTSLSALRGQLELAQEQDDPEMARRRVEKAGDQAGRTIHLTNQLLSHAMVIHRADSQIKQAVDVVALATSVIEDVIRADGGQNVEFEFDADNCVAGRRLASDPVSLREAIRNLVDNALKFAGPGAYVHIEIRDVEDNGRDFVLLSIEDNGPGIPEAERAKVLQRFYTLSNRSGCGLGLAIVNAVAQTHHGRIELRDSARGGLRVELFLPTAKARPA